MSWPLGYDILLPFITDNQESDMLKISMSTCSVIFFENNVMIKLTYHRPMLVTFEEIGVT